MEKGHIYFIMWVSWAWKWTLIRNLKATDLDLHIPLSYKSREKRDFEIDWVDSYFISKQDFENSIENWEFLEYAVVHGVDYYGTKYDDVILNWVEKSKIVVKELDILWLVKLKEEKPELDRVYTTIFLNIPVEKLEERIIERWDKITKEELDRRKSSAIMEENKAMELCDYIIDSTKTPQEVLGEVLNIMKEDN